MERLTERFSNGEAFIPNFVSQLYGKGKVAEKLAHYEDLEEQGRLIYLPCKVGDNVWYVDDDDDNYPLEFVVVKIEMKDNYILYFADEKLDCGSIGFLIEDFGKTVFLTKSEAEAKLKELKGE